MNWGTGCRKSFGFAHSELRLWFHFCFSRLELTTSSSWNGFVNFRPTELQLDAFLTQVLTSLCARMRSNDARFLALSKQRFVPFKALESDARFGVKLRKFFRQKIVISSNSDDNVDISRDIRAALTTQEAKKTFNLFAYEAKQLIIMGNRKTESSFRGAQFAL